MIDRITNNDKVYATIIRADFKSDGIEFFTPPGAPQQMGYMNRKKGYMINAHRHKQVEKVITQSFETLVVKSGKVAVSIYDEDDNFYERIVIFKGDVIMIGNCGHGFEMLEDSELIEIKQGPFLGDHETVSLYNYSKVYAGRR